MLSPKINICQKNKKTKKKQSNNLTKYLLCFFQEGSHSTADEITKQINDKERVAAALENPSLKSTVDECINHEID